MDDGIGIKIADWLHRSGSGWAKELPAACPSSAGRSAAVDALSLRLKRIGVDSADTTNAAVMRLSME
ncbi:hypothetical protein AB4305_07150 [Nocardia sp. 2YAB30]|uniref:hypothetical protein n=1 Tax=unclassified Nocardia TaxID=2637762 RepID=UPI003F9DB551